ncbi:hypothetical protein SAICODRAFT_126800 [Saitoella complicata NRRL Y-17804]|uniref:uncharacterized protein n=1 Tax=Saitoella complicata (strain BCRC 22490 / CBS 7301 / JCM 7358 / NBRC 10748 / NRRL Y-17804) TaxID=698492 RepID=UPI00086700AA|nr:uncharacterized protein SAICODRAFT_126800 [Saitoella complicata NRRL Y-17804]ODQ52749.1 hypothetical protein SAICODRAFT_126800 [Saitoella complicata NRRL Y-17804]
MSQPPYSLRPPLVGDKDIFYGGVDTYHAFSRGMCCPLCGRLSCRELWEGWECPTCGFTHKPRRSVFHSVQLRDPFRPLYTGIPIPQNYVKPGSEVQSSRVDGGQDTLIMKYELGSSGCVYHIMRSSIQLQDADQLFEDYQTGAVLFRRHPLKTTKVSGGRFLQNQFTHNAGAHYNHVVAMESTPLEHASPVINRTLNVLLQSVRAVEPGAEFNELLSIAYMKHQKMDYHDDGEPGVGPVVASLSLGSPGIMRFRPKVRRPSLIAQREQTQQPCVTEERAYDLYLENPDIAIPELADFSEHRTSANLHSNPMLRQAKVSHGVGGRDVLRLTLNHGDIMIMTGGCLQQEYEHALYMTENSVMRISATARCISVENGGGSSRRACDNHKPARRQNPVLVDIRERLDAAARAGDPEGS